MSRILLLIDNPEDRRLLLEALQEHEVIVPDAGDALDVVFDLCLVDESTLPRVWHLLKAKKAAEAPAYLPTLLLTARIEVGAFDPEIWSVVEELLRTPVQLVELQTRVRVLTRLRRMSQELERRHRELFRTLVEGSQIGVFLLSGTRFSYINEAGAAIFGYRADELIDIRELPELIEAEDRPALNEAITRHSTGECAQLQVTVRGRRKDGEIVVCDIYGRQAIYSEHAALMGQIVDVTERYRSDQAKNQFLAVLSHELRTPLTNILGWAKEAQDDAALVPQALGIILRNADVQSRMLENLLEVSRLVHGKLTLQQVPADLWQIMMQTVETMQTLIDERRLTVIVEPPDRPLPVAADVKRMQEVARNLLDNAIRFTDPDGTVRVSGARTDHEARITISDTGRGIAPEQLPGLFTLYKYSPENDVSAGLHLGLPLSKRLVELHGGHLCLESPGRGQGSTATVTLPLLDWSTPGT